MSCEYGKEQSAKKSYDKKDYKEMPGSQLKNTFFFSGFREAWSICQLF